MAFNVSFFNNVSSGASGSFKVWSYKNTSDTLATMSTSGYFNDVKFRLNDNDIIFVVGSDGSDQLQVTSSIGDTVTTIVYIPASGGAPNNATYIVQTSDPSLSGEQVLASLATGLVKNTTATGVLSIATAGTDYYTSGSTNVLFGGSVSAGSSGTAGYFASYPATAATGSLRLTAVANTGDTLVTISNAAHAQASVYSIPDTTQATSSFIMADNAGTQSIATGSLALTVGDFSTTAGDITAGSDANAGVFTSFPATTANGSLKLAAVDAGADFAMTISNGTLGQATVATVPDPGVAAANFILSESAGTQTIATGSLALTVGSVTATAGDITAGSSGNAGVFVSYPTTAAKGSLRIVAEDNDADTVVVISNAAHGQQTVVSIPDSGAATAVFTLALDQGTSGKVLTSGGADALATWETPAAGGGMTWTAIGGTTQAAVAGNGYISDDAGATTITLPATCAVGDLVSVQGLGAGGWILAANTGNVINVGQSPTSAGGTVTSAANYDSIAVVCVVADTSWAMLSSVTSGFTIA